MYLGRRPTYVFMLGFLVVGRTREVTLSSPHSYIDQAMVKFILLFDLKKSFAVFIHPPEMRIYRVFNKSDFT